MAEDTEPDESENAGQTDDQEPDEPEDADQTESVDLSRFYASTLKPFHDSVRNQNARISKMLADSAVMRMRPVLLGSWLSLP
ncbi:hypothetical protein [Streptomyces sp. NPDC002788]